ncbi:unnamed protein product [Caenorhabditis bovis]|uniref:Major facilitator superfamily (MFS) profile domain-containing protein n=1 Tax=Caenorhabditis bovis TaxID=2654633 RepID=A0A8S1EQ63_9PELO|nr:unnamed protein product [Caenorhabditis bovis]
MSVTMKSSEEETKPLQFLTFNFGVGARLANHVFELASVYGIARELQRTPIFYIVERNYEDQLKQVEEAFPGLVSQYKIETGLVPNDAEKMDIGRNCCQYYDIGEFRGKSTRHLHLTGQFYQSFKYFEKYKDEILNFVAGPKQFKTLPMSSSSNFISCIHVRRADFVDNKHQATDLEFTRNAWKKIQHDVFAEGREYLTVVMGDDQKFENQVFPDGHISNSTKSAPLNTTIWISGNSPTDDLIYSRYNCDSLLITAPSSTFGWWLGYISKGQTVYYIDIQQTKDAVSGQMRVEDFYPPSWHKLSISFALFYCCQQIFSIFYNFTPELDCADKNFTFSKPKCELSKEEICSQLSSNCSQFVVGPSPFHSMVMDFGMFCGDAAYNAAWVATIQFIGVLVGTIVYGHLGDHFGRRPISLIGISIGVAFGAGSGFAPNWQVFAALRFVCGTSIACILVVFYAYILEFIRPEQRVFLRSFFNWGYARVVFTFVCWLCGYWRSAAIATSLLALPIIPIVILVLPESSRWYSIKGRHEEARSAERRIAFLSGIPIRKEDEEESDQKLDKLDDKVYTIRDLFTSRKIAYRTIVVGSLWFSTSLSAFGSDLNSGNLAGNFYLSQFVSGAVTAFAKIFVFLLDTFLPSFDRRRLHQLPQIAMLICYGSIMLLMLLPESDCSHQGARDLAIILINIVGVSFIEITWDACYLVAVECFPTRIRTIGIGTCSLLARTGALLAPQMAYLSDLFEPAPYAVVCTIGFLSLLISFIFLPNTKGVDLAELDKDEA